MENINNLMEFLKLHYKEDRFKNEKGFNEDREQRILNNVLEDFKKHGKSIITYQSSKTSETIIFNCNLQIINKYKGQTRNISSLF